MSCILNSNKLGKLSLGGSLIGKAYLSGLKVYSNVDTGDDCWKDVKITKLNNYIGYNEPVDSWWRGITNANTEGLDLWISTANYNSSDSSSGGWIYVAPWEVRADLINVEYSYTNVKTNTKVTKVGYATIVHACAIDSSTESLYTYLYAELVQTEGTDYPTVNFKNLGFAVKSKESDCIPKAYDIILCLDSKGNPKPLTINLVDGRAGINESYYASLMDRWTVSHGIACSLLYLIWLDFGSRKKYGKLIHFLRDENKVVNTTSTTEYKSAILADPSGSGGSVCCGGTNNTTELPVGSEAVSNIFYATLQKRVITKKTYSSLEVSTSLSDSFTVDGLTVISDLPSWCTISNYNSTRFAITIAANTGASRAANLTFSKSGYTLPTLKIYLSCPSGYEPPLRYDNLTITSVVPSGKVNASGTNSISSGTVYYSYNDNNGNPKTGSEIINFTAVTGNNLGTTVTTEKAIATRQISLTKGEHTATGTVIVYLVKNDIYSTTLRINASSTSVNAGANSITLSGTLVDTYDSTKTKETTVSPTYSITSGSSYGSISNSTLSVFSRTTTYGASTRLIKVKGTYSNMTSNELTITQAANTYEDTWNNPSVSISCNIPATGGNVVSYANIDVTLKGTRTFSSGSTQSITNNNTDDDYWDSATYTWNGSAITSKTIEERKIASVNDNVGTLGVTVKIKGKSASASCTVTLSAAVISAYTYGNVTIDTFTVGNVPVSGGVPTTSITITLSYSYKINNTQYSGTYDKYDLEYSLTYKNTSGTVVSEYGKAALDTTANKVGTVTLDVTGEGNKTATKTIDVYQTANSYTTSESAGTFELTPKTSSINYASNTIQLVLVRTYTTYKDWATGNKTITSTSNVEFIKSGTASVVNGGNWCTTTTMSENYYRYSVSANDDTTTRSCTLRVTYKGNNYDSSLSQSGSTYSTEYSDPVIETFSAGNIPIKGGVTLLSVVTYKVTYNLISKKNGSVVSTTPVTHSNTNTRMDMSWTASVSGNISSNAKNTSTRTAGTISCKFTVGSKSVTSSTLTITLLADSVKSDVNTNKTWTATLLSNAGYNGSGDVIKTNAVSADGTTVFIRLRESYTRTVTWTSEEKDVTTVSDKLIPFSSFKTGLSTATSWLTINASNSNNEAAIIGVAKNTTTNSRTGSVSVKYNGSTKTVSIKQEKGGTTETKPTINSVATSTSGWWVAPVATGAYAGGGTIKIPVYCIALFKNATETTNKTYLYSGNIVYIEVNAGTLTSSQKTKTVSGSINPSTNLVTINNKSYPGTNIVFGVVGAGIVSTTIKIT